MVYNGKSEHKMDDDWGVLSHGGTPIAGWMVDFMENQNIKWVMTGGTAPNFRKPPYITVL